MACSSLVICTVGWHIQVWFVSWKWLVYQLCYLVVPVACISVYDMLYDTLGYPVCLSMVKLLYIYVILYRIRVFVVKCQCILLWEQFVKSVGLTPYPAAVLVVFSLITTLIFPESAKILPCKFRKCQKSDTNNWEFGAIFWI